MTYNVFEPVQKPTKTMFRMIGNVIAAGAIQATEKSKRIFKLKNFIVSTKHRLSPQIIRIPFVAFEDRPCNGAFFRRESMIQEQIRESLSL